MDSGKIALDKFNFIHYISSMKNIITTINAKASTSTLIIMLDGVPINIASSANEMKELCRAHFLGLDPNEDAFPGTYVGWGRGANGGFVAAISIEGEDLFSAMTNKD